MCPSGNIKPVKHLVSWVSCLTKKQITPQTGLMLLQGYYAQTAASAYNLHEAIDPILSLTAGSITACIADYQKICWSEYSSYVKPVCWPGWWNYSIPQTIRQQKQSFHTAQRRTKSRTLRGESQGGIYPLGNRYPIRSSGRPLPSSEEETGLRGKGQMNFEHSKELDIDMYVEICKTENKPVEVIH